ncbi:glycosyltransferase family 32 protein [Streptomyces sp. H39-S7]|uniref:glycosyltransferase family 32 protein n=1 Tax=Streptomyces sp. H39-S7 TaxID=3004357 RepID=UPI0022AE8762|nr:glycosyltransferase [Streptomyces sp. H39-S7]MCZ4120235.1 glycosyltransferase [Streptomyces sp. H39-S7]
MLSKPTTAAPVAPVPRVIVQFWDDGAHLPDDVQECMTSWATLEDQGFRREVYDDGSARSLIACLFDDAHTAAFDSCSHPAMRSDYFRLCYLARNGGFYVDADDVYQGTDVTHLFCDARLRVQALCYDTVTDTMVNPRQALASDAQGGTFIHYVNNNPLIAPAGHPVVVAALEASTAALLAHTGGCLDVQSVTGPGNLTVALARHALDQQRSNQPVDVEILLDWDTVAVSRWPLSYRADERNWRLWRQQQ